MEELDRQIVQLLVKDGRMSYTDLGKATGLSTSAVHQRVRRLEQRGVIRGYAAVVDPEAVGLPMTAFISVKPFDPSAPDDIAERLRDVPELEACHSVAGEENYILKVRVATPTSWRNCWPGCAPWRVSRPARRWSCRHRTRHGRPRSETRGGGQSFRWGDAGGRAQPTAPGTATTAPRCSGGVVTRETGSMSERPAPAETVLLRGGEVHSPADPFATAMLVERGHIAWVGSEGAADAVAGAADDVIDLDGALVTPAFTDAHVHTTATGLALTGLDLSDAPSLDAALALVRAFAAARPADRVLLGHGWDAARWPGGRPPTRAELDEAAGGRPLYLSRIDVHSAVVTTALLDLVRGDTGRPDAPLTGDAHHEVRAAALGAVTPAQRIEAQRAALARAASLGIASVHECAGPEISSEDDFTGLLRLAAEEPGPRVVGYWAEQGEEGWRRPAPLVRSAPPATCSSTAPSARTPPACTSRTVTRPATRAPPTWTPQPSPLMSSPAPRRASRRASTPSGTPP